MLSIVSPDGGVIAGVLCDEASGDVGNEWMKADPAMSSPEKFP